MDAQPEIYGLMAEFEQPERLLEAARRAYAAGYRQMNAYAPFAVHGLAEAVGQHRTWLPLIVFAGGVIGGVGGYLMQYWMMAVSYPVNVGGRPLNSWPTFIPVTFELTVLIAAFAAVLGMLWLNGLPEPYHPVFNVPGFKQASSNRFFLCIRSSDPIFDTSATRQFLEDLKPVEVADVEW